MLKKMLMGAALVGTNMEEAKAQSFADGRLEVPFSTLSAEDEAQAEALVSVEAAVSRGRAEQVRFAEALPEAATQWLVNTASIDQELRVFMGAYDVSAQGGGIYDIGGRADVRAKEIRFWHFDSTSQSQDALSIARGTSESIDLSALPPGVVDTSMAFDMYALAEERGSRSRRDPVTNLSDWEDLAPRGSLVEYVAYTSPLMHFAEETQGDDRGARPKLTPEQAAQAGYEQTAAYLDYLQKEVGKLLTDETPSYAQYRELVQRVRMFDEVAGDLLKERSLRGRDVGQNTLEQAVAEVDGENGGFLKQKVQRILLLLDGIAEHVSDRERSDFEKRTRDFLSPRIAGLTDALVESGMKKSEAKEMAEESLLPTVGGK